MLILADKLYMLIKDSSENLFSNELQIGLELEDSNVTLSIFYYQNSTLIASLNNSDCSKYFEKIEGIERKRKKQIISIPNKYFNKLLKLLKYLENKNLLASSFISIIYDSELEICTIELLETEVSFTIIVECDGTYIEIPEYFRPYNISNNSLNVNMRSFKHIFETLNNFGIFDNSENNLLISVDKSNKLCFTYDSIILKIDYSCIFFNFSEKIISFEKIIILLKFIESLEESNKENLMIYSKIEGINSILIFSDYSRTLYIS